MTATHSTAAAAAEHARGPRASARGALGVVLATVVLLALPAFAAAGSSPSAGTVPAPGAPSAGLAPAAAPGPASSAFSPPCYKIDIGVCVSIQNPNETNIVPPAGSFVCANQPNTTTDIPLYIKSQQKLDWPNPPHSGPDSPIALNVTGVLWNGDPYYSKYSDTVWHSDSATNWWSGPTVVPSNSSGYFYWYNVTLSMRASNNVANFFPGMTITWWIELTYNVSGVYVHHEGPHFQCTFSGAWPFSPYAGAAQYAGASATFEDVNLTVTPRAPNWNDSVSLILNSTQADTLTNATIGSAWVDVSETSALGAPIRNGTIIFPVQPPNHGFAATTTSATIPAGYAQVAGAVVTYTVTVFDVYGNQIVTPATTYVVGANGTFLSGIFSDDLSISSAPTSVAASAAGTSVLIPGQALNLTLVSRNPGTAISAAEVDYTVSYPLLHESLTAAVPFVRNSSTVFSGAIPGQPLGTFVNFTVLAWDFTNRLEISPGLGYSVPDLTTYLTNYEHNPGLQANSTFFYVLVYDNGSHDWVQGAQVQVAGPGGFFNSVGNTSLGLAYPNQTREPFVPLLLPANATYTVTVTDPRFVPAGGGAPNDISVTILGLHDLTSTRQTLVQASSYTVVQEGNALVFWLNTTPLQPISSPTVPGGTVPAAALIGLAATTGTAFAFGMWWRQIRARRKAEERRITL